MKIRRARPGKQFRAARSGILRVRSSRCGSAARVQNCTLPPIFQRSLTHIPFAGTRPSPSSRFFWGGARVPGGLCARRVGIAGHVQVSELAAACHAAEPVPRLFVAGVAQAPKGSVDGVIRHGALACTKGWKEIAPSAGERLEASDTGAPRRAQVSGDTGPMRIVAALRGSGLASYGKSHFLAGAHLGRVDAVHRTPHL
jgi:hypothetical protein